MNWLGARTRWIMLVSGALTLTMLYAAVAPAAALQSNFGATLTGPVAEIVVRNWGALVGIVGAMLIYGAFDTGSRRLALLAAASSKMVFILLVLTFGRQFLSRPLGIAVAVDAVWVVLFGLLLIGRPVVPRDPPA